MYFTVLADEFIKYQKGRVTPEWIKNLKNRLGKWKHFLINKKIDNITVRDVEVALKKQWADSSEMPKYMINQDIVILRSVFNYGIKRGYTANNPARLIDLFPIDKKKKYLLTDEQVDAIIEHAKGSRLRALLIVMKSTLARVGELLPLKWEDVDLERGTITISTKKTGRRGGRVDVLPLGERAKEALEGLSKFPPRLSPYVFGDLRPLSYPIRQLHTACKRAGVPKIGFHHLRHWGASRLASKNVPLTDIQTLCRHTSIKTTQLYIQSLERNVKEAVRILEE